MPWPLDLLLPPRCALCACSGPLGRGLPAPPPPLGGVAVRVAGPPALRHAGWLGRAPRAQARVHLRPLRPALRGPGGALVHPLQGRRPARPGRDRRRHRGLARPPPPMCDLGAARPWRRSAAATTRPSCWPASWAVAGRSGRALLRRRPPAAAARFRRPGGGRTCAAPSAPAAAPRRVCWSTTSTPRARPCRHAGRRSAAARRRPRSPALTQSARAGPGDRRYRKSGTWPQPSSV